MPAEHIRCSFKDMQSCFPKRKCQFRLLSISLILVSAVPSVVSQPCTMCPNGENSLNNPLGIIPQLNIPGSPNPTCEDAKNYANILDADSEFCSLMKQQAAFCGCPGVPAPANQCGLCPNGEQPSRGSRQTQYGDTCDQLDTYLSFISSDDCENDERLQDIQRHSFGCGCVDATATCIMCPDGTIDLEHTDKIVPFFTDIGISTAETTTLNSGDLTCEALALMAASASPGSITCDLIQDQAGFCGCKNADPWNLCSFCPDGGVPENPNFVTAVGDKCIDLYEYMTFMDLEACESKRAASMRELGFVCGCPKSAPSCTLCPDGSVPPDVDFKHPSEGGLTCGELALAAAGLSAETCADQRRSVLGVAAQRCNCPNAELPACTLQQNPFACTDELLDSVDEDIECECYAFCDGEFFACADYPGSLLSLQQCATEATTGCNRASAKINQEKLENTQPSTSTSSSSLPSGLHSLMISVLSLIFMLHFGGH